MLNATLKKVTGKTKDNKEWSAYKFVAGDYETSLFFPSKIEKLYLDNYLQKQAHSNFQDEE